MVNLLRILDCDPTLESADRQLEVKSAKELPRPYLGMSQIGESCQRKSWYLFRFAAREYHKADTLKKFEDGHRTEQLVIDRLKEVPGVLLVDRDGEGNQLGVSDLDGHFLGHPDGDILGIAKAPKTEHILEIKCTNEKNFNALKKLVQTIGEKMALRQWNPVYFTQGQLYMHYYGRTRHYLVVATPGGRDWQSVRTDYDSAHALQMIERARRIIKTQEPPEKISKTSDFFECKWCQFSDICHKDAMPDRSCRTCLHSTPVENGEWLCERFGRKLTLEEQIAGCPAHLFLPSLVPGEVVDSDQEKKQIIYKLKDGSEFIDSETT